MPLPLAPVVTVIHVSLATAVQLQPLVVVTDVVPLVDPADTL